MRHFDKGWRDRLLDVSPPETYGKPVNIGKANPSATRARIEYERGRHAASLWLYEFSDQHKGATEQGLRTIHKNARTLSFDQARQLMSDQLKQLVDAEAKFCSTNGELLLDLCG